MHTNTNYAITVHKKIRAVFGITICLSAMALIGCGKKEETRWDAAQQQSSQTKTAVSKDAVKGGSLNAFFPKAEATYDIVFKQEKTGFAQAALKKDGKDVATLSISDTTSSPEAAAKYKTSASQLGGYPSVAIGSQGTGVLVADRYQVQARSANPSFSKADRDEWLQKFDLSGLAALR